MVSQEPEDYNGPIQKAEDLFDIFPVINPINLFPKSTPA